MTIITGESGEPAMYDDIGESGEPTMYDDNYWREWGACYV